MPTRPHLRTAITSTNRRIGLLSTYPPKLCGIATFAAALEGELRFAGHRVDVVAIDDGRTKITFNRHVVADLVHGDPDSIRKAAAALSRCDVAIVQHEYGIFGGVDGDEVLAVLDAVDAPTIVIMHTVPLSPSTRQREVLAAVADRADRVVVMSDTAARRLRDIYLVDPDIVSVIPHGASAPTPAPPSERRLPREARPELLTWGLLGPGKGIEHVIDALTMIDRRLRPRYTVAGVTHPNVYARDRDAYRDALVRRSFATGVAGSVTFDDTYRDVARLTRFVASATVVVLPYDSREQVTSGVLVDAIATGTPVIATAFPHAVELLGTGAGIVVPHADPAALAEAIGVVWSDPELLSTMQAEARRLAPTLHWPAIAEQYTALTYELTEDTVRMAI